MSTNYEALRAENVTRYGTDIARVGRMLLAERYEERTHFIFELLQNAEDALRRRGEWGGSREVVFDLSDQELRFFHRGLPFDEDDVRGICGIDESTKDYTQIGRFGIGFKSVYVFTDSPEVHSGDEAFAIDSYVWPRAVERLSGDPESTLIRFPLARPATDAAEIAQALQALTDRSLLFLRQIETVSWSAGDTKGKLSRSELGCIGATGRHVRTTQELDGTEVHSDWAIFSRPVADAVGRARGYVELAFSLSVPTDGASYIVRVPNPNLIVYFPTALSLDLGFLVQGPYRTTPSRDNVPKSDDWNLHLVGETALLLVDTLSDLADNRLLTVEVLQCLPLDRSKFGEGAMLAPLREATVAALKDRPLLPTYRGGYAPGSRVKLARGAELRRLFGPNQTTLLFPQGGDLVHWLSEEITQDRTPEIRRFLVYDLGIDEVSAENLFPRLSKAFLEQQSDSWLIQLYGVLLTQPALLRRMTASPLVRLENGSHVTPRLGGQAQAFLPTDPPSEFPTVKEQIAKSPQALAFLRTLGVTAPNPIDDVLRNVIPRYARGKPSISDRQYTQDIRKISKAYGSDLGARRTELVEALRGALFVRCVEAHTHETRMAAPGTAYLASARLKALFKGVEGVLIVDDSLPCLRGDDVRTLLETCGAARHVQPVSVQPDFSYSEKREMRRKGGCEDMSRELALLDYNLRGLGGLLRLIATLPYEEAAERSQLLWDSLRDLLDRRGRSSFFGSYEWSYHYRRDYSFLAKFVRILQDAQWIPASGKLSRPSAVAFDATGWTDDPVLLSLIQFQPPIVSQLAEQVGIEAEALDLLKRLGITSAAELTARLNLQDDRDDQDEQEGQDSDDEDGDRSKPNAGEGHGKGGGVKGKLSSGSGGGGKGSGKSSSDQVGGQGSREFISYVAVRSETGDQDEDGDEDDLEGLTAAQRLALEERAIGHILMQEPDLKRTPQGNRGFDLFEEDSAGRPYRWVEVKAMRSDLAHRPVGLSHTQFEFARAKGGAFWLYIVEQAGSESPKIIRICDPVGKARTFTFDRGWAAIAEPDPETTP